jgi:hypothetical protein
MDTVTNLKAFLAVAGSGSFSAAARQLAVAPSVVTKRIDQLVTFPRIGGHGLRPYAAAAICSMSIGER